MNYDFLKENVFKTVGFKYDGELCFIEYDGVYAALKNGAATVGGSNAAYVCRALTEFAKAVSEGKTEFEIIKKPCFQYCGAMLDMSRDGVLRVESIKKYIDLMVPLGMNMLMLYTEDIFEMEKYPFFGYRRGRYTIEELREVDDYAYSLGVEIIPCVQTLGHLDSYLPWAEAAKIRDTDFNLMPGEETSYEFIEDILITMRKAFRSDNIHIGMDEASAVGTGAYFRKHRGEVIDQHQIILDHLKEVCALCEKHGYKPIIWSDLFFSIFRPEGVEMYAKDKYLSEETIKNMPDVRLMYWYYSGQEKKMYAYNIKKHLDSGKKIAFAGGGWNWEGYAPNHKFAFDCYIPALEACVDAKTEMVLNTLWGNGGCEASYFLCFPSNALCAEYCYSGEDTDPEKAWDYCEFVTKSPKSVYVSMDKLNYGLYGNVILGRKLLRQDIFNAVRNDIHLIKHNLPDVFHGEEPMKTLREGAAELEAYVKENGDWNEYFELEATVLKTAAIKAEIYSKLFCAYKEGDRETLRHIKDSLLPECVSLYKRLYELQHCQWMREYKAFGWETHCEHFGFQFVRMDYVSEMLGKYLDGEISSIDELEEENLNQNLIEYDTSLI